TAAGADDWAAVGGIAVDAGPHPDDRRVLQMRHYHHRHAAGHTRHIGFGPRAKSILGDGALATAKDDIAARNLTQIEIATDDTQNRVDSVGDRLRHHDLRTLGFDHYAFAEPAGNFAGP